ncbi:MAG: S-layer homology domain-containing protein, partial [Candidatus Margulisiibacteriota bacterium]
MNRKTVWISMLILLALAGVQFWTAVAANYVDPMRLGIGARTIGMGRAFTGLADDVNAIFYNPAALVKLRGLQVMSMSTTLLGEVNYLTTGAAMPTKWGLYGISIISRGVTGIIVQDYAPGRVDFSSGSSAAWNDNVIGLSGAWELGKFSGLGLVAAGATLKLFSAGVTGVSNADLGSTNGSGMDLDLGLLADPSDTLSLGLQFRNILPVAQGGKVSYGGTVEGVPAYIIAGAGYQVTDKLLTDLDIEYSYSLSRPLLYRAGLEYQLMPYLWLRAGYDQTAKSGAAGSVGSAEGNLSLGLGLNWKEFNFDYAYHAYGNMPENVVHFFSLNWNGEKEKPKIRLALNTRQVHAGQVVIIDAEVDNRLPISSVKVLLPDETVKECTLKKKNIWEYAWTVPADVPVGRYEIPVIVKDVRKQTEKKIYKYLNIIGIPQAPVAEIRVVSPDSRIITEADTVTIKGMVKNVTALFFGLNKLTVDNNGGFEITVPLKIGKNALLLTAFNEEGKPVERLLKALRISSFTDLREMTPTANNIKFLATLGVIEGFPEGDFKIQDRLTRASFAAVLTRLEGVRFTNDQTIVQTFSDVPTGHWAAKFIDYASKAGYVKGFPEGNFLGNDPITHVQSVAVASKFEKLEIPDKIQRRTFTDVPVNHWGAGYIEIAARSGLIDGNILKEFKPDEASSRGDAVNVLARTTKGKTLIIDLLDFNKGYEITSRPNKEMIGILATTDFAKSNVDVYLPERYNVMYGNGLLLKGVAKEARLVMVNGARVYTQANGSFYEALRFDNIGQNDLELSAVDQGGNKYTEHRRILRMPFYKDLGEPGQNALYEYFGLMFGLDAIDFNAGDIITRKEAAVLLSRALELPMEKVEEDVFQDVRKDSQYAKEIKAIVREGIITDWDTSFRPDEQVKKVQAAFWLAKVIKYLEMIRAIEPVDISEIPEINDIKERDFGYDEVKILTN